METPEQIGHGLGAFLVALVVTVLLAWVLLPLMPVDVLPEGPVQPMALGVFLAV